MTNRRPTLAEKIADDFRTFIQIGLYKPGQRLPRQSTLAQQYHVSPRTCGLAMAILRDEGLVHLIRAGGTWVRGPEKTFPQQMPRQPEQH